MSNCKSPCEGCALSPGAAANKEMYNHLKSMICLLGPLPFMCHNGQDWQDPASHRLAPREVFRQGWRICERWRREVAKLTATGYYENARVTKPFATAALRELDNSLSEDLGEEERTQALQALAEFLATLYRECERRTGEDLGKKMFDLAESGYFEKGTEL
jgi:hypothetical protein